jgi:outer membrane lipoprotein SlyB
MNTLEQGKTNMKTMKISIAFIAACALAFGANAYAKCDNCGTVTTVNTIKVKGEGTGMGAVAGGVLGGVLGHQIGGGRGKDVATVAGAAGGAYAGHQTEKSMKSKTTYEVVVKLESGESRTFTYNSATSYKVGDRIKVNAGKLTRQ